jgi:hypothetical protein
MVVIIVGVVDAWMIVGTVVILAVVAVILVLIDIILYDGCWCWLTVWVRHGKQMQDTIKRVTWKVNVVWHTVRSHMDMTTFAVPKKTTGEAL